MASEPPGMPRAASVPHESVEMPRPTAAPLVLAVGMTLLAAGVPLGLGFVAAGAVVVIAALGLWIANILPGRGHIHEPLVEPALRPQPVLPVPGAVRRLGVGMPGYRIRLPEDIHPISAGIKGGIVGGIVMPIPALIWGIASGRSLWYPVNLLAGMVLPGVGKMEVDQLSQFHASLLLVGLVIHVTMSIVLGLIYGVLLPTLPAVPRTVAWGGLLAPLLWTGSSYVLMGAVNPAVQHTVSWPWFVASQFIFGIVTAGVIMRLERLRPALAGLLGGLVGGLLMPIPAILWALLNGHTIWYPVNLLAGMVVPNLGERSLSQLERYHADWFVSAVAMHIVLSAAFGVLLALVQKRLPTIPGPLAWGGLVLPLLWTGDSYGLMGVVNPVLQERVDWPWFVVSQFVFGVVAAVVVLRSQTVHIPPAGHGR